MNLKAGDLVKAVCGDSADKCHDGSVAVFKVVEDDGLMLVCQRCGDQYSPAEYAKIGGCTFVVA